MTEIDTNLNALRHRYHASLSDKLAEIEGAWQTLRAACEDVESLAKLAGRVHRLAGSAKSYGYLEIGNLAASADALLDRMSSEEAGADRSKALRNMLETLLPVMANLRDALRNAALRAPAHATLEYQGGLDPS